MRALKDRYGFLFWLQWIVYFAGSFVVVAILWTTLMNRLFGEIFGAELVMTWVVSVFGSWFLLVIPFMRKKEQIWKRLNEDEERSVDAWFGAMLTFIGGLVASLFYWTYSMRHELNASVGMHKGWLSAVMTTWILMAFPFLFVMYRQADRIFKKAHDRQTYSPKFRHIFVPVEKRLLSDEHASELRRDKPVLKEGHLVQLELKDGRSIPYVFIYKSNEIKGIYDAQSMNFSTDEIVGLRVHDGSKLPVFDEAKWLRLDLSMD